MVDKSKVLCAITLLRPQTLNKSNVHQLSLRGPNVLFYPKMDMVTVLRMVKWREKIEQKRS